MLLDSDDQAWLTDFQSDYLRHILSVKWRLQQRRNPALEHLLQLYLIAYTAATNEFLLRAAALMEEGSS